MSGRNRMFRDMIMGSITGDPAWLGGEYTRQPTVGLRGATYTLITMVSPMVRPNGRGQCGKRGPEQDQNATPLSLRGVLTAQVSVPLHNRQPHAGSRR